MIKRNVLSVILLGLFAVACQDKAKEHENLFAFNTAAFKETYTPDESVTLEIQNTQNKTIDSIIYYVNDAKVASKKGAEKVSLALLDKKLGYQNLKALVYFEGENVNYSKN